MNPSILQSAIQTMASGTCVCGEGFALGLGKKFPLSSSLEPSRLDAYSFHQTLLRDCKFESSKSSNTSSSSLFPSSSSLSLSLTQGRNKGPVQCMSLRGSRESSSVTARFGNGGVGNRNWRSLVRPGSQDEFCSFGRQLNSPKGPNFGVCRPGGSSSSSSSSSRDFRMRPKALESLSLMWIQMPETGPARDLIFTILGASATSLLAGAAVWAWHREELRLRAAVAERSKAALPETPNSAGQKESVEWVNMVIQKIWHIYRRSLEEWLVGLLQPAIDKVPKPDYVTRVEIAEFSLNYEPISVRNVQRRASRRSNDLQYHIGLRYTGGARCLLVLHLNRNGMETAIPVGVHDLDVDGEMWVKLRLTPRKPYVGTLSIAFVRLPTIKLVLAPFRIVNLFAVPFLSRFLSKLLTVDLPRLLVLPRHITFDFLAQGEDRRQLSPGSPVLDLLTKEAVSGLATQSEPSEHFVGELTVTLCEARNLSTWNLTGWSNPYCVLTLGDRSQESKRNRETSLPAGSRDPVWNQDFHFWVEDPARQKLTVRVHDSSITLNPNIGYIQIPVWQLQDCVPVSMWSPIMQDGPFGVKQVQGEVRLLLTYKSYVDKENDPEAISPPVPYIKVFSDDGESDSEKDKSSTDSDSDNEKAQKLRTQEEEGVSSGSDGEGGERRWRKRVEKYVDAKGNEVVADSNHSYDSQIKDTEIGTDQIPALWDDEILNVPVKVGAASKITVPQGLGQDLSTVEVKGEEDWKAKVIGKTVEVTVGAGKLATGTAEVTVEAGKWVAGTAVDLWGKWRRQREKSGAQDTISTGDNAVKDKSSAPQTMGPREEGEATTMKGEEQAERNPLSRVGSFFSKTLEAIPWPGGGLKDSEKKVGGTREVRAGTASEKADEGASTSGEGREGKWKGHKRKDSHGSLSHRGNLQEWWDFNSGDEHGPEARDWPSPAEEPIRIRLVPSDGHEKELHDIQSDGHEEKSHDIRSDHEASEWRWQKRPDGSFDTSNEHISSGHKSSHEDLDHFQTEPMVEEINLEKITLDGVPLHEVISRHIETHSDVTWGKEKANGQEKVNGSEKVNGHKNVVGRFGLEKDDRVNGNQWGGGPRGGVEEEGEGVGEPWRVELGLSQDSLNSAITDLVELFDRRR